MLETDARYATKEKENEMLCMIGRYYGAQNGKLEWISKIAEPIPVSQYLAHIQSPQTLNQEKQNQLMKALELKENNIDEFKKLIK